MKASDVEAPPRARWWRGARGEWYVAGQVALMALVVFGPRSLPGWPAWTGAAARAATVIGALLAAGGLALFLAGILRLGPNLTPLPRPKDDATLVTTGAYGLVRHPLYGGGVLLAFGWALLVHGWLTLAYAAALLVFANVKSRREERWLEAKFPDYDAYRRRVRRLIPFVY